MAALAVAVAVALASLAAAGSTALAQTPEFKQIKLTEKHIMGFISSQKDFAEIAPRLQAMGDKPDAKLQADLEALAKKAGFASFAELDDVAANISMVMAGLDPDTGAYTDPIEAINKEMEEVKKDASIPEKDKKQMLEEMQDALKSTPPLQFKENIELVKKFAKDIEKSLQ
jgi:hypothetical protein